MRLIPTTDALGRQLREAREAAGLTQAELAERTAIPQSHLSKIEHGKHAVTIDVLCRLADALEADWGYDGQAVWFSRRPG